MKFLASTMILSVFLSLGCSGSGSNSPVGHINSKIDAEGAGALSGQAAIFEFGKEQGSQRSNNLSSQDLSMLHLLNQAAASKQPSPADKVTAQKAQNLAASIRRSNCPMKFEAPGTNGTSASVNGFEFPQLSISLQGPGCPLEMTLRISLETNSRGECDHSSNSSGCPLKGLVEMSYRVLDSNLLQQLGTTSGELKMTFDIDQRMTGSAPSRPDVGGPQNPGMDMRMKFAAVFEIKTVDLKNRSHIIAGSSNAQIEMLAPANSREPSVSEVSAAIQEQIQYLNAETNVSSKLSADVVVRGSTANEKYVVDGQAVTAEAYQGEREKFANSMMGDNVFERDEGEKQQSPSEDWNRSL